MMLQEIPYLCLFFVLKVPGSDILLKIIYCFVVYFIEQILSK